MSAAWRERLLLLSIAPVAVALTCVASLFGFSPWDDEGLMLSSASTLASGGRLYDDVRSFYGPVFHGATALLAATAGATHTVFRLTTAALILLSVAGSYALGRTVGLSPVASAAAAVAWCGCAWISASECLHPGWFCTVLLVLMALWLEAWGRLGRARDLALAGVCCGLLGGIKPNVAVFAALAAGAWVLARSGASARLRKAWAALVVILLVAIVLVPLTRTAQGTNLLFWSVHLGLTIAVLVGLPAEPSPHTSPRRGTALLTGGMLVGVLAWGLPTLAVADVRGYAELLVGSARFATRWWVPATASWGPALATLAVALLVPIASRVPRLRAPLRTIVAVAALLTTAWIILTRQGSLLSVSATLGAVAAALLMTDETTPRRAGSAGLLAVIGVLQHFHGFPVAGSQFVFATVFLVPFLFLIGGEKERRVDVVACLLLVVTALAGARLAIDYAAAPPLRLPGTRGVRTVAAPLLGDVVAAIQFFTPPDAPLLTLPGQASLNLWSGRRTVVPHLSTHWIGIDDRRRDEIHARLEQVPWIVINPRVAEFFWIRGRGSSAVQMAITLQYQRVGEVGPYEFWRRR